MKQAYIIAARRTPVAPHNGVFKALDVDDLAAPVLRTLLDDAGLFGEQVDDVILGNALYGGGNPARLCALKAGLPEDLTAQTLDRQCCSGLDAIIMAAERIRAGAADVILAGGVESYSRAPVRAKRPLDPSGDPVPYLRPRFTPWSDRDPDMLVSAARLADQMTLSRDEQDIFAIESHAKALRARDSIKQDGELVICDGWPERDAFMRALSQKICQRLPVLEGDETSGLTSATSAVEADAAACCLVVSEDVVDAFGPQYALLIRDAVQVGAQVDMPGIASAVALEQLFDRAGISAPDIALAEIMEAFAVQAIHTIRTCNLDPACVNIGGGALSRGHPIGASGAVLAVRLFHEMKRLQPHSLGVATIAAAGGLGTAALFEKAGPV